MPRKAVAAFIYDLNEVKKRITEIDDDSHEFKIVFHHYMERVLFRHAGFNVVRSIIDTELTNSYRRYMDRKISPSLIYRMFDLRYIPHHLQSAECHIFINDDAVLIAYF